MSRANAKGGAGQATAPASSSPETAPAGPEATPAQDTTAREARGSAPVDVLGDPQVATDAVTAPPAGEASAEPVGGSQAAADDSSGPANVAESDGEAPKAAEGEAPLADTEDAGQLAGVFIPALVEAAEAGAEVSAELRAAAADELQRLMRIGFEDDVAAPGEADGGVVLKVVPAITIWRGGRHFTAGQTDYLTHWDVNSQQLARILAEPAFVCSFVTADEINFA